MPLSPPSLSLFSVVLPVWTRSLVLLTTYMSGLLWLLNDWKQIIYPDIIQDTKQRQQMPSTQTTITRKYSICNIHTSLMPSSQFLLPPPFSHYLCHKACTRDGIILLWQTWKDKKSDWLITCRLLPCNDESFGSHLDHKHMNCLRSIYSCSQYLKYQV